MATNGNRGLNIGRVLAIGRRFPIAVKPIDQVQRLDPHIGQHTVGVAPAIALAPEIVEATERHVLEAAGLASEASVTAAAVVCAGELVGSAAAVVDVVAVVLAAAAAEVVAVVVVVVVAGDLTSR